MDQNTLFSNALGLAGPWKVVRSDLKDGSNGKKVLELGLDFERGSKFSCPECGENCGVHDTVSKRWRHLQFWQHETVLEARVPRVKCAKDGVLQVPVPWARPGSGFSLFFEAFAMMLCSQMPVLSAARLLGEHDGRLWRMIHHYVGKGHERQDWSKVEVVAIDETATRKGHRYATVVVDVDKSKKRPARLLYMTAERTAENIGEFVGEMPAHGAMAEQIGLTAIDMSPAYCKGVAQHLPLSQVVFDRFHVMKMAGNAVDEVRKQLKQSGEDMSGALWALRGNEKRLSETNQQRRSELCWQYKEIGRSMALKEMLSETWDLDCKEEAEKHLSYWCGWASRSRLEPFKNLSKSIKAHWDGIIGYYPSRITSAAIEAINGVLQTARRWARGYRNFNNFKAIAYWKAGQLDLHLPTLSTHCK